MHFCFYFYFSRVIKFFSWNNKGDSAIFVELRFVFLHNNLIYLIENWKIKKIISLIKH